jgi:SAM-dependent methyltransferase
MADPAPPAPGFYTRPGLHVETYDVLHREIPGGDDVGFFRRLATDADGPTLELGCGTGRVTIPLAEAGVEIVGLDRSAAMLAVAAGRRARLAPDVRRRARFVEGDMTDLRLGRRFGLVFAAFRVFMALGTAGDQRAALAGIRRHLRPGGLVVIDLFDPRLDLLTPEGRPPQPRGQVIHPDTGNRVVVTVLRRDNDPVGQRLVEQWQWLEIDATGATVQEERETLTLRWTYRHEMHHLLELCGFEVVSEFSDYAGSPPAYAGEQIWVARRPVGRR